MRRYLRVLVGVTAVLSCAAMTMPVPVPADSRGNVAALADRTAGAAVSVPTGSFASSSFVRVRRDATAGAPIRQGDVLWLQAARGGRASAQLAVHAVDALTDLRVTVQSLRGSGGRTLPAHAVQVRYPQFIPFDGGGVVADPLREVPSVDVPGGTTQPIWFTVEIPGNAAPGDYTTTVDVASDDGVIGSWSLQVAVSDVRLQPMSDRPFILDMWAHPDAVADQAGVELWSEQHWEALRPYLRDLAEHGQRVVNAAITEDPWMVTHQGQWRPQTWSHYRSTVEWRWDGERFSFDFSVFDRYVRESRAAGIGDRIHAFAMLQFDHRERFVYTDTRTGERVVEEVELGDDRYREGWGQFLRAFTAHLKTKGWYDDTSLGFDERPADEMEIVFDVLADEAPGWLDKIAIAANSLDVERFADYVSYNFPFLDQVPDQLIDRRRAEGKQTLFYTYMNPLRPNTVTASPPMSARMLGWVVAKKDLDGYLRWTYNSWPADVYSDPSFRYRQGDEYIVYPGDQGPISSIRWETFTDGQDDAELLRMYAQRYGRDELFQDAVGGIDPRAESTPDAWSAMLVGRARMTQGLAGEQQMEVRATLADTEVAPGDTVEMAVTATAKGSRAVPPPRLDLPDQAGWEAEVVSAPRRRPLQAGEQARWKVEITVAEDAGRFLYIPGSVTAGKEGRVLSRFATALKVSPPVVATAPVTARPASSPDATSPVTVSVPLTNKSGSPRTVRLTVGNLGFWQVDKPSRRVTVPAGGSVSATMDLFPAGNTGWTTIDVAVRHGGVPISSGRVDIVSGGKHVSDWEWADQTNGWGPPERDTSNGETGPGDGVRMSIQGREYGKGVGAHAPSRIVLDLAGQCSRFQTDIGVDDEVPAGSVRFRVRADGRKIYASPVMTGSSAARWVDLDVTSVERLELVVDNAGDGDGMDHADWAGAWLRCGS